MKKKVFSIIIAFTLLMALVSFATPVMAQGTGNSVDIALSIAESYTYSTGTVHYTITVFNNSLVPDAKPAWVDITFSPPGPTGAIGAYGSPISIVNDLYLTVGSSASYNYNGAGGATAVPALAVNLGAIPLNQGVAVAYAYTAFHADYDATPPYSVDGSKNIPVQVLGPNTQVTITPVLTTVPMNSGTTLTVTEANTGNDPLNGVYVQLSGGSTLKLERSSIYFVASTDPAAPGTQGVLDVGETWRWEGIPTGNLVATTHFYATGFGIDSLGTEITPPTYSSEYATTTVYVEEAPPPPSVPAGSYLGTGLLIAGLGGVIGFLVIRRMRKQTQQ